MNKFLISIVFVVFLCGVANASFNVEVVDFEKNYLGNEIIRGSFNIGFDNHGNEDFSSNLGGMRSIISLLENSSYAKGTDYTCNPSTCKNGFSSSGGQISKTFNLNEGESGSNFNI